MLQYTTIIKTKIYTINLLSTSAQAITINLFLHYAIDMLDFL